MELFWDFASSFGIGKEGESILGIFDQQTPYEVLGQLAGVAEILFVKVVVDGWDVGQRLLLGLAQEGRCSAQPAGRRGFALDTTAKDQGE